MKKILALALAIAMGISCMGWPALAEDILAEGSDEAAENLELSDAAGEETAEEAAAVQPPELVVGHTTVMKGDFFTEMFGNDTADLDVRALIHGYNLVYWDLQQGQYMIDPSVVKDYRIAYDEAGNCTWYLQIAGDLCYSDGSPITAWDYAFSMLLQISPEIEQIGGKTYPAEHILGYEKYITGAYPTLTGVEVYDDHQLVITLDHDFLPYFFEAGLLMCEPYPISEIAPGCRVYDDGLGVYISNAEDGLEGPLFTAELLEKTILDPETGYKSHPRVVSGPYTLASFEDQTACFEINPYYKGTIRASLGAAAGEELVKPTIERIRFTLAENDTVIEQLASGEMHLVNKLVYGPTIIEGMMGREEMNLGFTNYPRVGLSFLSFSCEKPGVNEMAVRQALAWCMDRDGMIQDYTQGFGLRVDGYYGVEQWEYQLIQDQLDYPIVNDEEHFLTDAEYAEEIEKWKALSLDHLTAYAVDPDLANALLDQAGWTLNQEGGTYRPGTEDIRGKEVDGRLVTLELTMLYPEGNHIIDTLEERFLQNARACGLRITPIAAEMTELLRSYYRETERTADMIYLATNFNVIVDPAITFSTDATANHQIWNNTYSDDEELYQLAVAMRKTEPGEYYEYVQKWIAFQTRYNEVLPAIPIYSNIYFDFYSNRLKNYNITGHVTWAQAILEASFGETRAAE